MTLTLFHTPCSDGYTPEKKLAREGQQWGDGAYPFVRNCSLSKTVKVGGDCPRGAVAEDGAGALLIRHEHA